MSSQAKSQPMKSPWCLGSATAEALHAPPTRPDDSSGEHNRKEQTHQADHSSRLETLGPRIKATLPLLEGPIKAPGRGVPGPTVQSQGCRKQSVRRQSTSKQAAPPSRGSPQHPKRWPTARSWRPRARPRARRPSKPDQRLWYRRRRPASSGSVPRSRKTI